MTIACYLEPTKPKADHWMQAFATGCGGRVVLDGKRADWATDHVVMGNWPVAGQLIAECKRDQTPFWYLDSGYIQGNGRRDLRVERGRFWPALEMGAHTMDRALSMGVQIEPWRYHGSHVLICLHGYKFGRPWSIDIEAWNASIKRLVRAVTDRPIVVRPKRLNPSERVPLAEHLEDAWCVVTHSSTIAVAAVLSGVPVFCEPTCPAAPVGRTDLDIENPTRPEREGWIAALAWRQWSRNEMRSGEAWTHVRNWQ